MWNFGNIVLSWKNFASTEQTYCSFIFDVKSAQVVNYNITTENNMWNNTDT